jgi:hypothetical protein
LFNVVSAQALGMAYYVRVGRELGVVEAALSALTYSECCQVNALLSRSLEREEVTSTREDAFARVRSDNNTLRRTGLAQWLAAAYLETREVASDSIQQRHSDIKRNIRLLKQRSEPVADKRSTNAAVA